MAGGEAPSGQPFTRAGSGMGGPNGFAGGGPGGGEMAPMMAMKRGGKIWKTGPYKLHRGERVLSRKQTAKYDKDRGSSRR